jgi:SAM-dependent methyltransferase
VTSATDAAPEARFHIKAGYRENPPHSYDPATDARFWTPERLRTSARYQYFVYVLCRDLMRARRLRSFLDVGSGPGAKVAELIAPDCDDLLLLDQPSARELVARQLPHAGFVAADLDALELDLGRRFDLIVCADVLEHLKDPRGCVRFIRSHLAAGGVAVLSTPERDNLRGPDCMASPHPEHVREWNAAEFRAFVESCGLAVERQLLMPQLRSTRLERVASRWLGRFVLRRRWAGCQVLVCRHGDAR